MPLKDQQKLCNNTQMDTTMSATMAHHIQSQWLLVFQSEAQRIPTPYSCHTHEWNIDSSISLSLTAALWWANVSDTG